MNALSWMLYAADALGSLRELLIAYAAIGSILTFVTLMGAFLFEYEFDDDALDLKSKLRFVVSTITVSAVLAVVVPRQSTVYMIAASEIAGRAAESEQGREVLDLLRSRIVRHLREERG